MAFLKALVAGVVGSVAVTVVHETARRLLPEAPRADILGVRAVEKGFFAAEKQPPTGDELHNLALGLDLVANSGYYSLVGLGGRRNALPAGALLGAVAGLGGITLPGALGLGEEPTERSPQTKVMTVSYYLFGGLLAGLAFWLLSLPLPADRARAEMMG